MRPFQRPFPFWPALALLALALPASAADTIPYPTESTSEPIVQAWMNRYLPAKGYVIGAWSANVVMLVSTAQLDAAKFPDVTTEVWSEVLRPGAAKAAGWRSAMEVYEFACDRDQYRTLSAVYYERGDRQGAGRREPGDSAWQRPEDGATLDTVSRAACFYGERKHNPPPPLAGAAPPAEPAPSLRGLQDRP